MSESSESTGEPCGRVCESRLQVRYAETDQMGVVYYANYFVWMEVGRADYCRMVGVRYKDLELDHGVLLAVVEASCRYLAPARYDEEVVLQTRVVQSNSRLLRFAYRMVSGEGGNDLARGETTHLYLGRDFRPTKLPERYLEAFGSG